jgi:hypothetical protein
MMNLMGVSSVLHCHQSMGLQQLLPVVLVFHPEAPRRIGSVKIAATSASGPCRLFPRLSALGDVGS